jgi:8-oxo-dGTP pyrophosphatase MutT (NUDIX family)
MVSVGPGHYVVVVLHVGGSKASDIKLVLQHEPRIGKPWFRADSILPNEEHVDANVRELLEEIGLTMTYDDLTLLSNVPFRVALPEGQRRLVYVFSAFVPILYVTTNLRTPALTRPLAAPPHTAPSHAPNCTPPSSRIAHFPGGSKTPEHT